MRFRATEIFGGNSIGLNSVLMMIGKLPAVAKELRAGRLEFRGREGVQDRIWVGKEWEGEDVQLQISSWLLCEG